MIKILSGKYKKKMIPVPLSINCRPSSSKVKESIFSILSSKNFKKYEIFSPTTRILDLFSGTGGLAFEALSRGAEFITLVDINYHNLILAKNFAKSIDVLNKTSFLRLNASNLPKANYTYKLVFMDPPYYKNLVEKSIVSITKKGWIEKGSLIVIELAKTDVISIPVNFQLLIYKKYGNSKVLILEYNSDIN